MDMGLLRNGNKGENVRNLQAMLNSIGAKLVEDGVFGSETEKAVRAYQTIRGLAADGVVGSNTWGNLLLDVSKSPAPNLLASQVSASVIPAITTNLPLSTASASSVNWRAILLTGAIAIGLLWMFPAKKG